MKKISLFIVSILLVIPACVLADTNPKVLTLDAKSSSSTVTYSGTTEDGSHAVMCKLYNSDNEEIDLLSSAVDNNKFDGSFTDVSDGTYTLACANYEGGELKKVEVVVNNTVSSPNTYDAGIASFVILLIISVLGITGVSIYLKKKKI